MHPVKVWIMAARPATLPAAIVPVLVGTAAAAGHGAFRPLVLAAALFSALCIQIGTNFSNDLFDFQKGADNEGRLGPVRVTQAGLVSPRQVARATWIVFSLAFLSGLYLVYVGGWPILAIGVTGIAAGVMYTGGPWPLAYHGLGDLFTFLYFGVIAVCGTYYAHAKTVDALAVAASLPVALLVTAILVVNNLRDADTDKAAGKRTLAVRMGKRATKVQYIVFVALAYAIPTFLVVQGTLGFAGLLPWLAAPLALRNAKTVVTEEGRSLNAALKGTGQLHLLYGLLFSLSLLR